MIESAVPPCSHELDQARTTLARIRVPRARDFRVHVVRLFLVKAVRYHMTHAMRYPPNQQALRDGTTDPNRAAMAWHIAPR